MFHRRISSFCSAAALAAAGLALSVSSASATDVVGTVTISGTVSFSAPIAGIALDDLTAASGPGIEATGNGEHCTILANGSAPVDSLGAYPESGSLSVQLEIGRGGMNAPDGTCLLQLRAYGNDGANVSAYGTTTVEVTLADIQGNAAIVAGDIVVRQSKTQAGLTKDCLKWVKKETKLKGKCNATLWKLGGTEGSLKCKNAGLEPADCDPAGYVDSTVALSFGDMDQQTDPPAADAIDLELLGDQAKCQRYIGKSAANFLARRNQYVQKSCIEAGIDDASCREQATQESKVKLSSIDNCVTDVETDAGTGLVIADVAEPCRTQCITAGTLDRKCLKDCLSLELSTYSDGLVGDVPECGNGIEQQGEACDDGNLTNGDCCTSTCTAEPTGSQSCGVGFCAVTVDACNAGEPVTCTPGTPGNEAVNCADGIDNDCDGLTDNADSIDCP